MSQSPEPHSPQQDLAQRPVQVLPLGQLIACVIGICGFLAAGFFFFHSRLEAQVEKLSDTLIENGKEIAALEGGMEILRANLTYQSAPTNFKQLFPIKTLEPSDTEIDFIRGLYVPSLETDPSKPSGEWANMAQGVKTPPPSVFCTQSASSETLEGALNSGICSAVPTTPEAFNEVIEASDNLQKLQRVLDGFKAQTDIMALGG